ncbi:hypothetical protein ACFWBB_09525 [Streptomyces sp. NPDC060000]|uniref:hypothetical protein n=1 Tax=Streptomyces sp. NPDC060000 TaxID=3347031 RepID=UPI003690FA23
MDFEVYSRLEWSAKLQLGTYRTDRQKVTGRTTRSLLSEPKASAQYAKRMLPVSEEQLVGVMA